MALDLSQNLSNALLEREILDSDEIDKIVRGEELPPVDRRKDGQPGDQVSSPSPTPGATADHPESGKPKKAV